jgi:hypothetical protein
VFVPDEGPDPEVEWPSEDQPAEAAETPHDDIMKRLMNYQRSLREGASPEEAAEAMRRDIAEPSPEVSEAAAAAESLAELLSTEAVSEEAEAPELEAEPVAEAEAESEAAAEAEPEVGAEAEAELPSEPEPLFETPLEMESVGLVGEVEAALELETTDGVAFEPTSEGAVAPEAEEAGPSEPAYEELSELAAVGGPGEPAEESRPELEDRVGQLESKLDQLGAKIAELRRSFQEMAIAADERLALMADEVEQARQEQEQD